MSLWPIPSFQAKRPQKIKTLNIIIIIPLMQSVCSLVDDEVNVSEKHKKQNVNSEPTMFLNLLSSTIFVKMTKIVILQ